MNRAPTWEVTERRRVRVVARDRTHHRTHTRLGYSLAQHLTTFCGALCVLHAWRGMNPHPNLRPLRERT